MIEIARMLVCSTANLPKRERDDLAICKSDLGVVAFDKGEYGWFVYAPSEVDKNLAPVLENILSYAARVFGAVWVCFDRDADPLPGFTTYD